MGDFPKCILPSTSKCIFFSFFHYVAWRAAGRRFTLLTYENLKELSRILFRYPLFYRGKIFGVTKSHFYVKCRERKLVKSLVKEDFRVFFTIFFAVPILFLYHKVDTKLRFRLVMSRWPS